MALSKAEKEGKFEEVTGAAPSVTITTETPSNADKTSNPVDNDAKPNEAPVRTNRPDVPIAQTLAAGAGAHEPNTDPHIGDDGRFYADEAAAEKTRNEGWGK